MAQLQNIEVWMTALLVTAAIFIGFALFARWCGDGAAVPPAKLDELQVGMDRESVQALLGQPRERRRGQSGLEQWVYGARMKRHVLLMEFGPKGLLASFAHGVPHAQRSAPPIPNHES